MTAYNVFNHLKGVIQVKVLRISMYSSQYLIDIELVQQDADNTYSAHLKHVSASS